MAKELTQVLEMVIKEDDTTIFEKEETDSQRDLLSNEFTMQQLVLANGASDSEIDIGGLAAITFIWIKSDQKISIKLSGTGNTAIVINTANPTVLNTDAVTSIHASNASGTDANVQIYLGAQDYT